MEMECNVGNSRKLLTHLYYSHIYTCVCVCILINMCYCVDTHKNIVSKILNQLKSRKNMIKLICEKHNLETVPRTFMYFCIV